MISVWVQFLLGLQVGNGTFDAQILEIGLVHGHGKKWYETNVRG